jgi:putative membrane protein
MKKVIAIAFAACIVGAATAAVAAADDSLAPPQDENWLQTSISGDQFEIAGGKIVLARASTPAVRALGRRLIHDHTQSLHDAIDLAHRFRVGVPPAATPSEQWELNRLKNMPKGWFDVQYTSLEVKDHQQDIQETGFEAREGQQWEFRQEARKDLPMLNMHLRLSKRALAAAEAGKQS